MSSTMRGARRARAVVADALVANLPPYLVEYRTLYGLDATTLPDPAVILGTEPRALDRWPAVAVAATRRATVRRVEPLPGDAIEYRSTYAIRVFTWVRAEGWEAAIDQRDDFAGAVGAYLLDHQDLGGAIVGDPLVDENTFVEEYSDVAAVKGERFVAGAFAGFNLGLTEVLARTPRGTVETIQVDAGLMTHPALQ